VVYFEALYFDLSCCTFSDRRHNEVLGARIDIYMAAKKWDMAAALPATW